MPINDTDPTTSSRLPQATGRQRELTAIEQRVLDESISSCERTFDASLFFHRLATQAISAESLRYVFGQYGHFRLQLHRWFGICIVKTSNASDPAQRHAIMALADHVLSDLRDNHDELFQQYLHQLGFPPGTSSGDTIGPATEAYIQSFFDDCRAPAVTWFEALAALGGRELSVALRNRRLLRLYFAPRGLPAPTWLALHAELEVDHCLDVVGPVLAEHGGDSARLAVIRAALERAMQRHSAYLDDLIHESDDANGNVHASVSAPMTAPV